MPICPLLVPWVPLSTTSVLQPQLICFAVITVGKKKSSGLAVVFPLLVFVAASFAPDFGTLVATQGVVFGIGILIMYYPVFNMLNEWFIDRRGLALGILCAATGVSGLFYPFLLEILLNKYGPATTLRVSAVALTVLGGPVLPLLKGRYPSSYHDTIPKIDYSIFKMPLFYIFSLATLLQGLGYYFPRIYLPSYTTLLGLSDRIGALLLVVVSVAQMLGRIAFGYSSDLRIKRLLMDKRVPVEALVFISSLMAGIAILGLWGMASSIAALIMFALIYGIFAGGFVVLWARMVCSVIFPQASLSLQLPSLPDMMTVIGKFLQSVFCNMSSDFHSRLTLVTEPFIFLFLGASHLVTPSLLRPRLMPPTF